MISTPFSVSRSRSNSSKAPSIQISVLYFPQRQIRRSPHSALPQRPQVRRQPITAVRRPTLTGAPPATRLLPVTARRSPHDARRLLLTGVTARRRYIPESRPFETIVVPKLQKAGLPLFQAPAGSSAISSGYKRNLFSKCE
nr:hypothetical protein Iba_chr01dCG2380 [Ipomoea batatas]